MPSQWSTMQSAAMQTLGLDAWSERPLFFGARLLLQKKYMVCHHEQGMSLLLAYDFYTGDTDLILQQTQMRDAMLKAIGFSAGEPVALEQGKAWVQSSQGQLVLALGLKACSALLSASQEQEPLKPHDITSGSYRLVHVYDMLAMMRNPCLKKDAWPLLKGLRVGAA